MMILDRAGYFIIILLNKTVNSTIIGIIFISHINPTEGTLHCLILPLPSQPQFIMYCNN